MLLACVVEWRLRFLRLGFARYEVCALRSALNSKIQEIAMQTRRAYLQSLTAAAVFCTTGKAAQAQQAIKIGFSAPLTGPFAMNGKHMLYAAKLYIAQHGGNVSGRRIELIVRDDAGLPDQGKRIAQEMIVNDKVAILAGYNVTPVALAASAISAEAKIPQVVMAAGTSVITERSPYIVRTFSTQAQLCVPMGRWAAKNGIKKVVTLVSDFAPGHDSEKSFADEFKAGGGEVLDSLRVPLINPEFAPYLQRARDAKPEAMFLWFPGVYDVAFSQQYVERGLHTSGIKLVGVGDVVDDEVLNKMNDSMLGIVTTLQYSVAHVSEKNKVFVEDFKRATNGERPNAIAVAAYDGMHLICEALNKTSGNTDGDAVIAAMKGMAWESPRGPIAIDPETRDVVQDIYVRRLERVNGELFNVEFDKFDAVKDPIKAAKRKSS
jgi:branched-chain amino acid transport system substrate-binding protein